MELAKNHGFSNSHPVVLMTFFIGVLGVTMFHMHPVFLLMSLITGFIYNWKLRDRAYVKKQSVFLVVIMVTTALMNPMFNHAGVTILFYTRNGNPVTAESIFYGLASAVMFAAVILWFSCFNAVMTSDKLGYLFGKLSPALGMIFSMALRFVPLYQHQIKQIAMAQKGIGNDFTQGSWIQRGKNGIKILSIMVTWALESAIETADSMKARGYGTGKRSHFSIYSWSFRDKVLLTWIVLFFLAMLAGGVEGYVQVRYFPSFRLASFNGVHSLLLICFFCLCSLPIFVTRWEEYQWRCLTSRISTSGIPDKITQL